MVIPKQTLCTPKGAAEGAAKMPTDRPLAMLFDPTERFNLDVQSPVPLYHQIEQIILQRIKTAREPIGQRLPPEKGLAEIFGVSRATVKSTLDKLAEKGLIERRRAVGTRVISQELTEDLARLTGYSEEMQRQGLSVSTEVLEARLGPADSHTQERLQLEPGEEVLKIRRLRGTSEFFPVALLCSQIPARFGIDPQEDFHGSLYSILEQRYGKTITAADQEIRAAAAVAEEAEYLQLAPGSSVLVMERITYTTDPRPLELVRAVYRPDRYKYSIRLRR